MVNFLFIASFRQNAALEINEKKIRECEGRIRQLTEELESRNQKLEVRLHLFVTEFIESKLATLKIVMPPVILSVITIYVFL